MTCLTKLETIGDMDIVTASAADFRAHLTGHLALAEHEREVAIVERHGKPVVALVPFGTLKRLQRLELAAGLVSTIGENVLGEGS